LCSEYRSRWLDYAVIPILLAVPAVLSALVVNWLRIQWFPPSYGSSPDAFGSTLFEVWWPAVALAIPLGAFLAKQTRREVRAVLSLQYVEAARAKGLGGAAMLRAAFKPAAPVFINLAAFILASLMGGAVVMGALLTLLVGTSVGLAAARLGGWVESLSMEGASFLMALPSLFVVLGMRALVPWDVTTREVYFLIVGILAFTGWPDVARVVRAKVLAMEAEQYIEAAQAAGCRPSRVLWRHLFPGLSPTGFRKAACWCRHF
jgi:ABC-type dipeptide/oligopeptide/nickel transport system permease subunit